MKSAVKHEVSCKARSQRETSPEQRQMPTNEECARSGLWFIDLALDQDRELSMLSDPVAVV
jgi:hypothetical protein